MPRAGPCSTPSASRSAPVPWSPGRSSRHDVLGVRRSAAGSREGEQHGQEGSDPEAAAQAEAQGAGVHAALAGILKREGYIEGFAVGDDPVRPGRVLEITMKYTPERAPTISGLRRVSKPGLRVYTKADRLPRVLGGLGVAVLSTSQGLMTDREARQRRVGGEVLRYVW